MFGIPIDTLDFKSISEFLETGVREGIALDFKRDFPADLGKTLAAFANTYGGMVLIGVEETKTGAAQVPLSGVELKPGLKERVLQIGLDAVYPPVFPEVRVVEFKSAEARPEPDRAIVVARVHESEDAPHAVENRTVVYLRADNISDRYLRKATIGELEWLLNKRQRSAEEKGRLLTRAMARAAEVRPRRRSRNTGREYGAPAGSMKVWTVPVFPRKPLAEARAWAKVVQDSQVELPDFGWPLPDGHFQRAAGGTFYDGSKSYSEFQEQGMIFHDFDYWWDFHVPGTKRPDREIYSRATASILSGALELSRKIYRKAGYPGLIEFHFEADGLKDSYLLRQGARYISNAIRVIDSELAIKRQFGVPELDSRLMEIAKDVQREIYWAFGIDVKEDELNLDLPTVWND